MILTARQSISQADIDAVVLKVLKSDFLTQGAVPPFPEQTVADYCGAKFGVAVNSRYRSTPYRLSHAGRRPRDWGLDIAHQLLLHPPTVLSIAVHKSTLPTLSPIQANMCAVELERKLIAALGGKETTQK